MHGTGDTSGGDVPAIELVSVSRYFGTTVAIDDVSFSVDEGEFFSIIGPSGSGKTTAIRMVAGLEVPTDGSVRLFGEDVTDLPPYERDTPMVFQSYALFPHLSVVDNVAYGLRMRGVGRRPRRARAREVLDLVGLEGHGRRRIDQLSGGQQQRVALARALVTEPRVVLLDEALGALDAALRVEMQSELRRLQKTLGCTFVHVTHDQSEALAMADRILVLHQGRLEQVGTPSDVFARPATRFVANFVGKNNLLDGVVEHLRGPAQASVATDIGDFVASLREPSAVTDGEPVTLVIRADAMRRVNGDAAGPNRFDARVLGSEYEGARVTIRIGAGDDLVFHLEEHESLTAGDPLRPGARITVGWDPNDAYVMN